jgi:hypothetical protein
MALAMQRTHRISFSQLMLHAVLLLTLCLCTCKRDALIDKSTVIIDPKVTLDKHWWDDKISDDIVYFPLFSTGKLPLSGTRKQIRINNILVSTHYNRAGIYFHKLDGELIFHQLPTGQGPLEFSEVNAFTKYDSTHILINDPSKNAILKYDFVNRKITAEYKTNTYIFSIYYAHNRLLFTTNDIGKGIVKYVDNFNFDDLKVLIKGNKISNLINSPNPYLRLDDDRVVITIGFLDTIFTYNMKQNNMEKKYILGENQSNIMKVGEEKISNAVFERKFKAFEKVLIPIGAPSLFKNYLAIPLLGFTLDEPSLIINLKTDESFLYNFKNNKGSKMDFVECLTYPTILDLHDDGYIYSIVDELDSNKRDESPGWPFIKAYNKLIEDKVENPVIVRFKMRE